jgi:RNA polymerase sigma-70 factor (ECF subfamily)
MKTKIVDTFKKIYNETSELILKFCQFRVSDREQALDITQEAFMRLWHSLSIGQQIKNGKAYIFTLTRRLIIDWYRKKKSISLEEMNELKEMEYEMVDEKTIHGLDLEPESRFLLQKMDLLPPKHREILELRFIQDLTPLEIGNLLGISANVASVRIYRAVAELKKVSGYEEI